MLERDDFAKRYRERAADRHPRVPLSAGAGLRLGRAEGRRRARRHRPEVQPAGRPRAAAPLRPGAAVHPDACRCSRASTASTRCRSRSTTTSASPRPPSEMFGKLMSISDELMWRYYELLSFALDEMRGSTNAPTGAIRATRKVGSRRRSSRASTRARRRSGAGEFESRFRDHAMPEHAGDHLAQRRQGPGAATAVQAGGADCQHFRSDAPDRAAWPESRRQVVATSAGRRGRHNGRRSGGKRKFARVTIT